MPAEQATANPMAAHLAVPRPLPVSCVAASGRVIPLSEEEHQARAEAFAKAMAELRSVPDDDPPDALERMVRGVDENRPPGQKLFEGMY